jgi:hypothetical protein
MCQWKACCDSEHVEKKTYVSTRAIKLAVCVDVEVDDVNSTAAVMLDDLVRSVVGTTANNPRFLTCLISLDGDGVLTDILKPDKLEAAMTLAMDTFGLERIS